MGGSIGEHVWRQSYKMSTSQVTFGANLIKCELLMSTSTVILARILQSVNFSISIRCPLFEVVKGHILMCDLMRVCETNRTSMPGELIVLGGEDGELIPS